MTISTKPHSRRFVYLLLALCFCIAAVADNRLSLSQASGTPGTEVSVSVSLSNTDSVSALQLALPLGRYLHYIDGSCTLSSARSNGHVITASQVDEELRIYIYSLSLSSLRGEAGELLTFRLSLGKEPADYILLPQVVLSDATGKNLTASVSARQVSILAPKLQVLTPKVDFGHIPIRDTYVQSLSLQNVGNLPLDITDITSDDALFIPQTPTLTIAPQATADIAIEYSPTLRGRTSARLSVLSNAINGVQYATIAADPFSVNELYVSSASGVADSIVGISLTMNNMEPIVAVQCAFLLPAELVYEKNSFSLCAPRGDGHIALSSMHGDTLSLYIYSPTNRPLIANSGELATFRLRLNGNSNTHNLTPMDVVLSNANSENMLSEAFEGSVSIQSPQLNCEDSMRFTDAPVTEVARTTLLIRNYGDAPLLIERATFLAEGYSIVDTLPLSISPGNEAPFTVAYSPKQEGDFSTTMNLYTNDPTMRMKTIAVSGHIYEPNNLSVEGTTMPNDAYSLSISLSNYSDIVAAQFDVHWSAEMATSQAQCTPSPRLQQHNYSVTDINDSTYRVLVYSMANTPIAGHDGELLQLLYTPKSQQSVNYCGIPFTIDNIVLSNANGENKQSLPSVVCQSKSNYNVVDTLVVCDKYTWNGITYTKSGVYTDTLQTIYGCDSIVNLHLTVNRSAISEVSLTVCDSLEWHGITYTESGDYTDTLQTIDGCDSICILHLTVNKSVIVKYSTTACDSYFWDSNSVGYSESGDYTAMFQTVNGCDSREVLHLTINKSDTNEYYATACDRYTWLGKTYSTSGDYTEFVETDEGCSYETLHLTIHKSKRTIVWGPSACDEYVWNGRTYTETGTYTDTLLAANGCDSIVTLHLTVYKSEKHEFYATACDSYVWYGETYSESGDYTYQTTTAYGCNSTEILHLTINKSVNSEIYATACDSYTWNGRTYTESGHYLETLQTSNGCDSIDILHLTINHSITNDYYAMACDSYIWNGRAYTESGDYTATFQTSCGCDSVEVLHLTVNHSIINDYYATACDSYIWNGQTYTESGDYTQTLQTIGGCDSMVILHLTIGHSIVSELTVSACDSYIWNGRTYTESGDYTETFQSVAGCNSVEILHLTINHSITNDYYATACDSYIWNGSTYTESGDYTQTLQTISGCDSIVILHLTIGHSITSELTVSACDNYTWNRQTYTQSGDYTETFQSVAGCDSIEILHLTIENSTVVDTTIMAADSIIWRDKVWYESGEYVDSLQTVAGCDSIIHIKLIIDHTGTGLDIPIQGSYHVTPNPATNQICIHGKDITKIQIFSSIGTLEKEIRCSKGNIQYVGVTDLATGTYIVVIHTDKGDVGITHLIKTL